MGDTSIVMTAKELLDIAQGATSWTNCKQVQRVVAEVFRLRAKVREQGKAIKRLESTGIHQIVKPAPVHADEVRERDETIAELRAVIALAHRTMTDDGDNAAEARAILGAEVPS